MISNIPILVVWILGIAVISATVAAGREIGSLESFLYDDGDEWDIDVDVDEEMETSYMLERLDNDALMLQQAHDFYFGSYKDRERDRERELRPIVSNEDTQRKFHLNRKGSKKSFSGHGEDQGTNKRKKVVKMFFGNGKFVIRPPKQKGTKSKGTKSKGSKGKGKGAGPPTAGPPTAGPPTAGPPTPTGNGTSGPTTLAAPTPSPTNSPSTNPSATPSANPSAGPTTAAPTASNFPSADPTTAAPTDPPTTTSAPTNTLAPTTTFAPTTTSPPTFSPTT